MFEVAAWEIEIAEGMPAERTLAVYKLWLRAGPAKKPKTNTGRERNGSGGLGGALELGVLAVRDKARIAGCSEMRTVKRRYCGVLAEGRWYQGRSCGWSRRSEWVYGGQERIEGEVKATRIEAEALGLKPLKLRPEGA